MGYWYFCQYLKTIHINACDALLHVIPSHAVGQLPKLERLEVSFCNSIVEIFEIEGVKKDVGEITDIGKGSQDTSSV